METVTWWSLLVVARPVGLAVPLGPQAMGAGMTRGRSQGEGHSLPRERPAGRRLGDRLTRSGAVASPRGCVCGGGRLGRGRKPAPRADLISGDKAIDSALESMGGLFTSRPWIQQGLRICCLDYKSQLQYTSVSVALGELAPLPAVSSSNRSSAQLGYQALRQREACLFEKRL